MSDEARNQVTDSKTDSDAHRKTNKRQDTHTSRCQVWRPLSSAGQPLKVVSGKDEARTAYSLMVPEARQPAAPLYPLPNHIFHWTRRRQGRGEPHGKRDGDRTRERESEREGGCETGSARVRQFKVSVRGTQSRAERSGRGGWEERPEPNWFVMPDMPVTVLTRTAPLLLTPSPTTTTTTTTLNNPPHTPHPLQLFSLTASKLSCTARRVALASVNTVCVNTVLAASLRAVDLHSGLARLPHTCAMRGKG